MGVGDGGNRRAAEGREARKCCQWRAASDGYCLALTEEGAGEGARMGATPFRATLSVMALVCLRIAVTRTPQRVLRHRADKLAREL